METYCPPELARLYRMGRIIPFVGAGASMGVSWKDDNGNTKRGVSWKELVDEAVGILGIEDAELLRMRGEDLQILEYFRIKQDGVNKLTNRIFAQMQAPDTAIEGSIIHEQLCNLSLCDTFYTTNFDDFLERSLAIKKRPVSVIRNEHDLSDQPKAVQVVKFHGDFDAPDSMVLSERDYHKRMGFDTPLDWKFRSDLLGKAVLFIGYSFRDPNVSYLFRIINEKLQELPQSFAGKRAYIVIVNPSDFEFQLFSERKIEVVPVYSDDRSMAVSSLIEAMRK